MVSKQVPTAPKALYLSKADRHRLLQLGDDLHSEIVDQYEHYAFREQRTVSSRWKLVRSDGEVRAYRESKQEVERRKTTISPRTPQAWMAARSNMPRVMVVGMIQGTLDDAMLAHTFQDTASLRAHCTYQRDDFRDCAVLSMIEEPTEEEPFNFMGVAWFLKTFPLNIMRNRDTLTLSFARMGQLTNGEQYGVKVDHSILLDAMPVRPDDDSVRADISVARVFRQASPTHVEVFMMDYLDAKGSMPESIQVQELGKTVLTVRETSDTALNKKLRELLAEQSRHRVVRRRSATVGTFDNAGDTPRQCEYCDRRLGRLFGAGIHKCQLCDKLACGRCVSKRELVLEATEASVTTKGFEFCISCLLATRAFPAKEVARREERARKGLPLPALEHLRDTPRSTLGSTP